MDGEGRPGQSLPRVHLPGQEGGWVEAPAWLPQDLRAPGEKPGRGWVPRRWGGSQNNGIPCVWIPSKEVHIFHGDRAHEKAGGRVSLTPAEMWLHSQPAQGLLTTDTWLVGPGHRKTTTHCFPAGHSEIGPVAPEAGRGASQRGAQEVHGASQTQSQPECDVSSLTFLESPSK